MAILTIEVLTGSYNFKYVKNERTEQSVHKYTEILRMAVQVAGV